MRLATLLPAASLLALTLSPAALAQRLPPEGATPLSQVLAQIERERPVRAFIEVEWEKEGYWEIELIEQGGARVKLKVPARPERPWSSQRKRGGDRN